MAHPGRLFIISSSIPRWEGAKEGEIDSFEEVVWRDITGYDTTNGVFVDAIEQEVRPDDTIWIRNSHLYPGDSYIYPLAKMIRDRLPEIAIGLSVALSFPSREVFRTMSEKEQKVLLLGMLGSDLIGFEFVEEGIRFVEYVQKIFQVENDRGILQYGERLIKIEVFPTGTTEGRMENIKDFFNELRKIKIKKEKYQVRFFDIQSRDSLLDRYRRAKKRLFLLDYDGTLTPIFNLPSLARPDNLLLDILSNIAQNRKNSVYIISGRDSGTLEKWLGHLPVNIIAEHGARIRLKDNKWEEQVSHERRREVKNVTESVAGYDLVRKDGYEIGDRIAVKGAAIRKILSMEDRDFILAIGDDKTDEDMFTMLADVEKACTIKVGQGASFAQYNLHTPQMVISLLGNMSFLEQQSYK